VQYVTRQWHLQALAIATLDDLLKYLRTAADPTLASYAGPVQHYRDRYGV
jgi:orotate phosphoribosyltransferase